MRMKGHNSETGVRFFREFRHKIELTLKESWKIIVGEGIEVVIDGSKF